MVLQLIHCLASRAYWIWGMSWGYSSVGRAPALQAGGQEFESPYLHQSHTEEWLGQCTLKTV